MIERQGDLWETEAENIAITTNGVTKADGSAVMGAGVARQAVERCPGIERVLGALLRETGNHVYWLGTWNGKKLWSFPTKHVWSSKSEPELIQRSAVELDEKVEGVVALPRPGCRNGGLRWPDVRKLLVPILLESRFVVTDTGTPLAATPQRVLENKPGEILAVSGSRKLPESYRARVVGVIGEIAQTHPNVRVVSGGAEGVDTWVELGAQYFGTWERVFPADWHKYGPTAGTIRNQEMVEAATSFIAFWDGSSSGTGNAIDCARRQEKVVRVFLPEDLEYAH